MKESGLLAAGYNYVTLGGIGYANGSTYPDGQHGWPSGTKGAITRNASGFLQVGQEENAHRACALVMTHAQQCEGDRACVVPRVA